MVKPSYLYLDKSHYLIDSYRFHSIYLDNKFQVMGTKWGQDIIVLFKSHTVFLIYYLKL